LARTCIAGRCAKHWPLLLPRCAQTSTDSCLHSHAPRFQRQALLARAHAGVLRVPTTLALRQGAPLVRTLALRLRCRRKNGTCTDLATPKPQRPLLARATALRQPRNAALHLRAPTTQSQWRQRPRCQQRCEQAPAVRVSALAMPNVRHERRPEAHEVCRRASARWRG
jgi:hypothetical protein